MPLDFATWIGDVPSLVLTQIPARAAVQWARIQDKPTDVVFMTGSGMKLAPQTVRIEFDDPAVDAESVAGLGATRGVTIFGIRGHPELDDTNIKKGYRFNFEGKQYTVLDPLLTHGQVQARCESVG